MELKVLIKAALEEDVGSGDVTTKAIADADQMAAAEIRAKEELVVAGMDVARLVFKEINAALEWLPVVKDGDLVSSGTMLAAVRGRAKDLLLGERVALNFLQHLSGVATQTRKFVQVAQGTKARILDTRKTTPGWRALEKYAVRMGGGNNHRIGLHDRYMIKNNHIAVAGSLEKAIQKVLSHRNSTLLIEVEVRSLAELKSALGLGVDIILCDHFSIPDLKEAVALAGTQIKIEASGNITLENVASVATAGVDFISVGALTHSAPARDIHMRILA